MTFGKNLITILGPTAIGKTELSIRLAEHLKTEIISADSRQFFIELNIGVAKPDQQQLDRIKHHFISFLSLDEEYNAGKFEVDALQKLTDLFQNHANVICTGGSMMYIDALLYGLDELPGNKELRALLVREWKEKGLEQLADELIGLDPSFANEVDLKNPHRIIRALEVCRLSGKTYTELRKAQQKVRDFGIIKIGLTAQRDFIYDRINQRVDQMFASGLVEEVRTLLKHKELNSLNTVGYKELFDYFDGRLSLEEASLAIKQHTRNYAKRQLTWWRNDKEIKWISVDENGDVLKEILEHIPE